MFFAKSNSQNQNYDSLTILALGGGMFFLFLVIFMTTDSESAGMSYLFVLALVQLTPSALLLPRRRYNYITFVMLNHFITYTFAKINFLRNIEKTTIVPEVTIRAIKETTFCSILIIVTYYFTRYFLMNPARESSRYEKLKLTNSQYFWVGAFVALFPVNAYLELSSIGPFLWTMNGSATILLYCANAPSKMLQRVVKASVYISAYIFFLKTGSLGQIGTVASIVLLIALLNFSLKNLVVLVLLGGLGSAIQTVKYEYRIAIRSGEVVGLVQSFATLQGLLVWKFIEDGAIRRDDDDAPIEDLEKEDETTSDLLAKGFSRIGDDSLERVMDWTPRKVPFWGGETYAGIPFLFIPRFLWFDKPRREFWNKFGKDYGYLSSDDNQTSVAVGFLAEAYMNFGFSGLYSVACLFGVFIALLETIAYYIIGCHNHFTFLILLIPLTAFGNDLSTIINGELIVFVLLITIRHRLKQMVRIDAYA